MKVETQCPSANQAVRQAHHTNMNSNNKIFFLHRGILTSDTTSSFSTLKRSSKKSMLIKCENLSKIQTIVKIKHALHIQRDNLSIKCYSFFFITLPRTYFANPSKTELSSTDSLACFNILKYVRNTSFIVSVCCRRRMTYNILLQMKAHLF